MTFSSVFWTTDPFATKFGLMAHHHNRTWYGDTLHVGLGSCEKFVVLSLKSRSQWGSYSQMYICFYHFCCIADLFLTRFDWMVPHCKLGYLCKEMDCYVQGQGHSEVWKRLYIISVFYFLYHWSLGNHARCVDVLWLIIKWSTTKWALLTDSYTVTSSITRHIMCGVQGNKPGLF